MLIQHDAHLSYCTNIHPGESWSSTLENLKTYTCNVKQQIAPNTPFGIGLRLSKASASSLLNGSNLSDFKTWLSEQNMYVFTINGFPYGAFHDTEIKAEVHTPDWTTEARLHYTKDLMDILAYLLPDTGMEGSVSTSPISYKHWFYSTNEIHTAKITACKNFCAVVAQLVKIKERTGKILHLDIEPEPDGFLENTQEVINFYNNYLLKSGAKSLQSILHCSVEKARDYILTHLQICYDVCHFALAYESPAFVIHSFKKAGINIGKVQISAAITCNASKNVSISTLQNCLKQFDEPTYLHQSVIQLTNGQLLHFPDLVEGINAMQHEEFKTLKTHFHVPIFIANFEVLKSTQNEIIEALDLWKQAPYSKHLEVETYTWSILPKHLQTDIANSIVRELDWVRHALRIQ